MRPAPGVPAAWSVISLSRSRGLLSRPRYRILVGMVGLLYGVVAMIVGGMLYFPPHPIQHGWFFYLYPSGPGPSWAYPAILAGGPSFFLDLPLLSGILMTLTAAGIGLGMSLGVLLGASLLRRRRAGESGPRAVGSVAGLTPVMLGLVTLGACCSTAAAATAGVSLVAQSSGTSPAAALANAWYLGVFQVVVVYIALIAQEQLLHVYGFLLGEWNPTTSWPDTNHRAERRIAWSEVGRAVLRVALLAAGATWSLAVLTVWFAPSTTGSNTAAGLIWVVQHEVPGPIAVLVALFPEESLAFWSNLSRKGPAFGVRTALVLSGLALTTWMPTPWIGPGGAALGNELMGFVGLSPAWGAVAPPELGFAGLALRWTFQFVLIGGFCILLGIAPWKALYPLQRRSQVSGPAGAPQTRSDPRCVPPNADGAIADLPSDA